MKKLHFIIMSVALLLLLSSCMGGTSEATETSVPEETQAPEPATLTLSENGTSPFYIVYSGDCDIAVKDTAIKLSKQIGKYTGATPKVLGDTLMDNPMGDLGVEHQYEILLGATNREESVNAHKGMRSRDYAVTFEGDKIILAGTTADAIDKACERFITFVLIKQGKDAGGKANIVLTEDDKFSYTYGKYSIGTCTVLGSDITEYNVVYQKDDVYSAERHARLFANIIQRDAGYVLPITSKSTEGGREIVFGGSDTVQTRHGYTVRAEGTKLIVSAECMEGYRAAYEYLTKELFRGEKVEITEGFTHSGTADVSEFSEMDAREGEYRVIFNNIYGNHRAEHPVATRNAMNAELHYEYLPDVIGLQEASEHASAYFIFMLAHGYKRVEVTATNSNAHNYTPLIYREDRLEVIDKGYHLFDDGAGDKSKSITWAVFKDKTTGDVFAVGGTHFYWTSDELGQSARLKDAAQVSELAKQITDKYDCPVIVGGDLNCRIDSAPIGVLTGNGFKNLQKLSPNTMDISTHHAYSEYNGELGLYLTPVLPTNPYSKAIDHALVYNDGKLTPKMFRVLYHDYSCLSSDHCPVMVDFDIN
ncbi:MAG: endonuclease/exonuclease/phosphatase family protein [Eubacteriales bacterium]